MHGRNFLRIVGILLMMVSYLVDHLILKHCFLVIVSSLNGLITLSYLLPIDAPYRASIERFVGTSKIIKALAFTRWPVCWLLCYFLFESLFKIWSEEEVHNLLLLFLSFSNLQLLLLFGRLYYLVESNVDAVLDLYEQACERDLVKFTPPPLSLINKLIYPWSCLITPEVHYSSRIPNDSRLLFVSNHSLGGFEMPLWLNAVYKERGILPRGLADHIHFALPFWGECLKSMGAVDGNRKVCSLLMESNQPILVYPGGSREVLKKKTDSKYGLLWGNRQGFARLAVQHKYTIVPCCAVGTEDFLDIAHDIPVHFIRKGQTLPVIVPNTRDLQKVYFWFGEPISTNEYGGCYEDADVVRKVRDLTKASIESGIQQMLEVQSNDPRRYLRQRFADSLREAKEAITANYLEKVFGLLHRRDLSQSQETAEDEKDGNRDNDEQEQEDKTDEK